MNNEEKEQTRIVEGLITAAGQEYVRQMAYINHLQDIIGEAIRVVSMTREALSSVTHTVEECERELVDWLKAPLSTNDFTSE